MELKIVFIVTWIISTLVSTEAWEDATKDQVRFRNFILKSDVLNSNFKVLEKHWYDDKNFGLVCQIDKKPDNGKTFFFVAMSETKDFPLKMHRIGLPHKQKKNARKECEKYATPSNPYAFKENWAVANEASQLLWKKSSCDEKISYTLLRSWNIDDRNITVGIYKVIKDKASDNQFQFVAASRIKNLPLIAQYDGILQNSQPDVEYELANYLGKKVDLKVLPPGWIDQSPFVDTNAMFDTQVRNSIEKMPLKNTLNLPDLSMCHLSKFKIITEASSNESTKIWVIFKDNANKTSFLVALVLSGSAKEPRYLRSLEDENHLEKLNLDVFILEDAFDEPTKLPPLGPRQGISLLPQINTNCPFDLKEKGNFDRLFYSQGPPTRISNAAVHIIIYGYREKYFYIVGLLYKNKEVFELKHISSLGNAEQVKNGYSRYAECDFAFKETKFNFGLGYIDVLPGVIETRLQSKATSSGYSSVAGLLTAQMSITEGTVYETVQNSIYSFLPFEAITDILEPALYYLGIIFKIVDTLPIPHNTILDAKVPIYVAVLTVGHTHNNIIEVSALSQSFASVEEATSKCVEYLQILRAKVK